MSGRTLSTRKPLVEDVGRERGRDQSELTTGIADSESTNSISVPLLKKKKNLRRVLKVLIRGVGCEHNLQPYKILQVNTEKEK